MLQKCQAAKKESFDERISRLSRLVRNEVLTVRTGRESRGKMLKGGKKSFGTLSYYTMQRATFPHVRNPLYSCGSPTMLFRELLFANRKYTYGKKGLHSVYLFLNKIGSAMCVCKKYA